MMTFLPEIVIMAFVWLFNVFCSSERVSSFLHLHSAVAAIGVQQKNEETVVLRCPGFCIAGAE